MPLALLRGYGICSRAPRGDPAGGRTPRASACGCIGHSAARRPQGAALNKYGKSNHAGRTRRKDHLAKIHRQRTRLPTSA